MEKDSLTISLPRAMKTFIKGKLREGRFSTPSEYIRSLIRSDQETGEQRELEAFARRGVRLKNLPELSEKDWASVEALIVKCGKNQSPPATAAKRAATK
jgi:antitoxin ParD1/3/4